MEVTSERSVYDLPHGVLKINRNQTITSFFSRVFPHPIEVNLQRNKENDMPTSLSIPFANQIAIGQGRGPDLLISLMRTVRVPENSRRYDLPPDMGHFPVFDVQNFSQHLPVSMVAERGVFIPMYRKSHPIGTLVGLRASNQNGA